mgnify:CR=1 FL=1
MRNEPSLQSKFASMAEVIPLEQAVGKVLAHDITEIRPGQFKGPAFKKGHVVKEEDLEHLRRLGKENLFVLHIGEGEYHEDDAAQMLADALCGANVVHDGKPAEGKIALKADSRGLLKVNVEALTRFNMVPDVTCAGRHNNTVVERGETVAGTRAIPLVIRGEFLHQALAVAREAGGIFSVKPFGALRTGVVITGNEVYYGRVDDKFAPILRKKLAFFDCPVDEIAFCPDDRSIIERNIRRFIAKGIQLVLVAGGMSVDPDDVSRMAIKDAGAEDLVYGSPVLPGAMFLYARIKDVPIMGLPACVLYYRATVFDLMLPRVLAGERITRRDLAEMAHGGLCLNCDTCHYPICPFGK